MAGIPSGGAGGVSPGGGEGPDKELGSVVGKGAQQSGDSAKADQAQSQGQGPGGIPDPSQLASGGPAAAAAAAGAGGGKPGPPPVMGAGGTSEAGDPDGAGADGAGGIGGGTGDVPGGGMGKAAGTVAAVPVAGAAAQLALLMMFLKMLKMFAMAMAAMLANLWGMIWGGIVAAAKAVGGFFMAIGAGIASAVGGAVSAVTGAFASAGAMVVTAIVVVTTAATGIGGNETAQRDAGVESCRPAASSAMSTVEDGDVTGDAAANAEIVYSVFAAWGMPDENIAGILGNWDAEARIDPTSVEGIFHEPHTIGPDKQTKLSNGSNGYGIGLGQWTFGRHDNLRSYADSHNEDWYTMEIQLSFMISDLEATDADVVKDMIANSVGTPVEAAVHFHDEWERSADTSMDLRRSNADKWMGMMGGWEADHALGDSLLDQAETTLDDANESSARAIQANCIGASADGDVALMEGGVDEEGAQAIVDLYNEEGSDFLKGRYGGGGPGACGNNKAMNCVSFSTYFANKYTELQQYAPGNGVATAGSMASILGKETSSTPTAYSVASGPGSGAAGHTFVVLGVTDTEIIYGEAGYCAFMGRVSTMPIDEATNGTWEYVDLSDIMLPEDEIYTS